MGAGTRCERATPDHRRPGHIFWNGAVSHYIGDQCQPPHRWPEMWVANATGSGVAHHLEREDGDYVIAECGQKLYRPDFDPPSHMRECGSCAVHHYAREERIPCSHCGKTPRRRSSGTEPPR